jgi:hypothetical protein
VPRCGKNKSLREFSIETHGDSLRLVLTRKGPCVCGQLCGQFGYIKRREGIHGCDDWQVGFVSVDLEGEPEQGIIERIFGEVFSG